MCVIVKLLGGKCGALYLLWCDYARCRSSVITELYKNCKITSHPDDSSPSASLAHTKMMQSEVTDPHLFRQHCLFFWGGGDDVVRRLHNIVVSNTQALKFPTAQASSCCGRAGLPAILTTVTASLQIFTWSLLSAARSKRLFSSPQHRDRLAVHPAPYSTGAWSTSI
jgi:hypothetical protein